MFSIGRKHNLKYSHQSMIRSAITNSTPYFNLLPLTVCDSCVWAGVENVWDAGKKPEARKMPLNRAQPKRPVHAVLGIIFGGTKI